MTTCHRLPLRCSANLETSARRESMSSAQKARQPVLPAQHHQTKHQVEFTAGVAIHKTNRSTSRRERARSLLTLVATTTLSRGARRARNQRPRSSSLRPRVSLRCGTGYLTVSTLKPRRFLGKKDRRKSEGDDGAGEPTSQRSRRS
jgi:hypothetical protein